MESTVQPTDFFTLMIIGILGMIALALALVVFFYVSQRKLLKEQMRQQELQLKHQEELLYSTIQTQEEERKRIAKDLHDEVGSKLNVIFMNMHRLRKQTKTIPEAKQTIKDINNIINTTIGTTRRISHDLLPPTLDNFGLIAALQELTEGYAQTELHINFDDSQAEERLEDKLTELNLFRVIQELIKNSIVHGKSKNVDLQVITTPPTFMINYKDDGVGFDMAALSERKGLGTQNIESRLNMSGANIAYDSAIGKGVKAVIQSC